MKIFLILYIVLMNVCGFALMGIDKWKAARGRWRISERTLFLTALLGGSIGSLVGMYLFRHKTRHLRFSIGIPVILVLQLLLLVFISLCRQEHLQSPSAAVSYELNLIQELDEDTIRSFVSYENMMNTPPVSSDVGSETTEAVKLFFQNFKYHLHSETISGDTATVTAEIINIDTKALAKDLCLALTAHNINITPDTQSPQTMNDYFTLLRDTLKENTYELTATTAYFHLQKRDRIWVIQSDETLQDELVSGFISWMHDSDLVSPQEVLTIYLDEFSSLSGAEWMEYLKTDDIFSTGSETYSPSIDACYMDKIAEFFSYSIDQYETQDNICTARLTITSIDMPKILEIYKQKLVDYAHTSQSITSDDAALADASAGYLLETLQENAQAAQFPVTVTLTNDGTAWQLNITDELTNAFLGDMEGALEQFNS